MILQMRKCHNIYLWEPFLIFSLFYGKCHVLVVFFISPCFIFTLNIFVWIEYFKSNNHLGSLYKHDCLSVNVVAGRSKINIVFNGIKVCIRKNVVRYKIQFYNPHS